MPRKVSIIAALAIVLTGAAAPALAGDPHLSIVNDSGMTIARIEMSAVSRRGGDSDLLGTAMLRHGARRDMVEPAGGAGACRYDLRVVFANGQRLVIRNLDARTTRMVTVNPWSFNLS
ncbi:hypothetical protein IP88_14340 [alpha proteobacterium AAP81b]|nr:hypothetical protein IP88_14340 [alpha proteobacterium AAP81b]